jgi:DNA-binding transcriptional ArsR family regulator
VEDEPTEQEHLALRSPAQFKALGHPVRHRLVNVLRQRPATLGQLTAALGSTKGTIGYHMRILREAGLVRLASTRQVRGGTEQYFALVSRGFKLHEESGVGPEFLINAALAEMLPPRPGQGGRTLLRHLWLTPDEADALATRLQAYATDPPPADSSRGEAYGLLVSLYAADIPALSPDEHDTESR